METDSDEETELTRKSVLQWGVGPAIRASVLPYTDTEPGNLTKRG